MQKNSKGRICGKGDEIFIHRISEYNKLAKKEYKTRHDWGKSSTGNSARNVNFIIPPYHQMVCTQTSIRPGEWDAQTSLRFWDTNESYNLGQTSRLNDSQQLKRTCCVVDFVVSADHKGKFLKNVKMRDKYLDLARVLIKIRYRKVTVIPVVVGELGMILKVFLKRVKRKN